MDVGGQFGDLIFQVVEVFPALETLFQSSVFHDDSGYKVYWYSIQYLCMYFASP